jgi:RNA recognition motif-containing protein
MAQHHTTGRQGRGPQRRNQRQGRYHNNDRKNGYRSSRHNQAQPVKLTFFQKLLKFVGLYKPSKGKQSSSGKTNTRIARSRENRPVTPKQPVTSPRLYVGNLSYEASETDLEDLFKGVGAVKSVEVIYNPRTHKSKGYAFIEMQFLEDAVRAVEVLHDQLFMGRLLTVSAANERQEQQTKPVDSKTEVAQEQTPEA